MSSLFKLFLFADTGKYEVFVYTDTELHIFHILLDYNRNPNWIKHVDAPS